MTSGNFIKAGLRTVEMEALAVGQLAPCINEDFQRACETILACKGRVVVTGMGKSGHIGNKIAATLASTGTPAFFVHPGEASHTSVHPSVAISVQGVVIPPTSASDVHVQTWHCPYHQMHGGPWR